MTLKEIMSLQRQQQFVDCDGACHDVSLLSASCKEVLLLCTTAHTLQLRHSTVFAHQNVPTSSVV